MYYQEGGQQDQIMQLIQMYAQMSQTDPEELMQQLQQMAPEEQQQAIQQMAQALEQASSQQQPDMTQAAMAYGGYTTGVFAGGGEMIRRADGSYSKKGLWDNIRANKGSGKKPTKKMLEQEKEIRNQEAAYGGIFENGGTNNAGFDALPDYVQAKILKNMGYGGYYDPMEMMADGGEPNGGMAMGQMAAVADKMNKLRQFVSPEQNLDPWIASKLAVIDDSTASIADYMMYNPEADGGEDMEMYEQDNMMQEMANGGYTVTKSNDRKGKTHKVTGPDGTVKYFGDSKLGQHPKDPERKKAFYARHKKNLANNPFFRAFARKTWKEGGSTFSGNAWYQEGGEPQLENYPDYGSYRADLYRYNAGQMGDQAQQAPMQEERKLQWHPEWEEQGIDPEAQYAASTAPVVNGTVPMSSSEAPVAASQTAPVSAPARSIDYSGVSVVDLLRSAGKASDYNSRKELAAKLGIDNYYGSAKQNLEMIKKVTSNPAVLDDYQSAIPSKSRSSSSTNRQSSSSAGSRSNTAQQTVAETGPAPATSGLTDLFAQAKKAYIAANPGMTSADYDAMMSQRPGQTYLSPSNKSYFDMSSDEYDDSYMLNKIENDPDSPANVRTRKQKEFARNMGLAALAAVPFLSWTRYFPMLRGLPQFANAASKASKALPSGVRALPQGAKALPKPAPTNWVTNSGMSFGMGGGYPMEQFKQGGINLDPSKKGTFKAQATRMGMGVQEAASAILNAPEGKYTPAMRKKANFAKNFAKQMGGPVEGEVMDVSPEQLEALRQQGYQFEII
jgi:hypothetical protein